MTKYLPSMLEVPDSVPTSGGWGGGRAVFYFRGEICMLYLTNSTKESKYNVA